MAIKIGGNDVKNLTVGAKQVKKLYQGTKLVWEDFKGFTFEGEKTRRYRIEDASLPETDSTKFKNMWAIVDGVDRLIWRSDGLETLRVNYAQQVYRIDIYNNNMLGTYTTLDTGVELPDGTYTFKIQLL